MMTDNESSGRTAAANLEQYKLLMSRRQSFTQMIWQIPVLATGAEGVLIPKALDALGSAAGIALAGLSVLVSFAALQLLSRHRLNERMDTQLIRLFEDAHLDFIRTVAATGGNNKLHEQIFGYPPGRFASIPSGTLWNVILLLTFGVAAAVLLISGTRFAL